LSPKEQHTLSTEAFLRSINICYDAESSDRISHFRPTSKCATLLRALLDDEGEKAFLVTAPYGTGKSLTTAYLLHLLENREESRQALLEIEKRLAEVSPELAGLAAARRKNTRRHGLVVALQGAHEHVPGAIKAAVLEAMRRLRLGRQARPLQAIEVHTLEDALHFLKELNDRCTELGIDRVLIAWDEFGRHVEALVASGRASQLAEVQQLAEFASRAAEPRVTLALLMHQGLLHYGGNVPQTVRNEWKKIEGRFNQIQYVDDSKELYRLIATVVRSNNRSPKAKAIVVAGMVKELHSQGLFKDFSTAELKDLLTSSYPLEPVTLFLLPRIASRVAQNERTLFSFLHSADLSNAVPPAALYDYFSSSMRADTTVGGTHRQWLETESAISKAQSIEEAAALKTACLLGLGTSGERARTSLPLLVHAVKASGVTALEAEACIRTLIDRKLLLHRRHNDEVSVWHGTDLDLRTRLDEQKRLMDEGFDLLSFLTKESKAPVWKPVEYNDDYCIRRYFSGEYQSVRRFDSFVQWDLVIESLPNHCDGKIIYLIAESADELVEAEGIARDRLSHERLLVAIPRTPLRLHDAAVEVACLTRMQHDPQLLVEDPLAAAEVRQMLDDARDHLQRLVDQLISPAARGPRWFYKGKELAVESARHLRHELSRITRAVYTKTPKINNEMIVRKKPSAVVVNARKKLLMAILERAGQEELGIIGNFPDRSMFRSVLLGTGLYRKDRHGRWSFAPPQGIADDGLREIWNNIREFLTTPSDRPKDIRVLFDELSRPPYGLRTGLLPILMAAALKAFPSAISLTHHGEYVQDILPSQVEGLCRTPSDYRIVVLDVDEQKLAYLRDVYQEFSVVRNYQVHETDLIRMCFDAIQSWKSQLPPAALTTRRLTPAAVRLRTAITKQVDPIPLLFTALPEAVGVSIAEPAAVVVALRSAMRELTEVAGVYAEHAASCVRRAVGLTQDGATVRGIASRWARCFSAAFTEDLIDGVCKGLLARMQMEYTSDDLLLDSLASLLVGKPLSRWDDSTLPAFDRELTSTIHRIEDSALDAGNTLQLGNEARQGLVALVRGRMTELAGRLADLLRAEKTNEMFDSLRPESQRGS
jgi:hypothetical protein